MAGEGFGQDKARTGSEQLRQKLADPVLVGQVREGVTSNDGVE